MKKTSKVPLRFYASLPLGVAILLALSACSEVPSPVVLTKTQIDRVTVPTSLLAIADEPAVPTSRLQSAVADYIVHLKINDDECHLDIQAIAETQK